jgi:hypothetical protein
VAVVALFASMGGTGYAATQVGSRRSATHPKAKAMSTAQVKRLIAGYVHGHTAQLRGSAGAAGAVGPAGVAGPTGDTGAKGDTGTKGDTGVKGDIGPQGPGAVPINETELGGASNPSVATFGPWTVSFSCSVSPAQDTVTVSGPGAFWRSDELGTTSVTLNQTSGSLPASLTVTNTAAQGSQTLMLQSGTDVDQVTLEQTATNGLFQTCRLIGEAIPAPAG